MAATIAVGNAAVNVTSVPLVPTATVPYLTIKPLDCPDKVGRVNDP